MRKTGLKAQETKEANQLIEIYMRMKDLINNEYCFKVGLHQDS